ncbi:response regulator transcription factor [Frisingicoccus sp.]|uniref:response regulator transcription factor n=1 Tax=Frisingicoccus sp. TaxID=1918627 RepID=UPI003AB38D2D
MLVDDDATSLRVLSDLLSKQFQIYEACGVNEALRCLDEDTVDLICSDYNMPDRTGLELLERLYKSNQKFPFILMSGMEEPFVVNSVKFYGGTFCDKTNPDLLTIIRNMAVRSTIFRYILSKTFLKL